MKDRPGFDLREAWVIASVSVLVVYLIGQLKPHSELGTIATIEWLIVWMTLLSFPSSLLSLFLIQTFIWIDYRPDIFDSTLIWATLFAAGYWQWCRFVPYILRKEQMITLKLDENDDFRQGKSGIEADDVYGFNLSGEAERPSCSRSGSRVRSERTSGDDDAIKS
jgi:hypothetical protein